MMPVVEAAAHRIKPFDLTGVRSKSVHPLHEVHRLVLDRNPDNYFAGVEQSGFDPGNVVPGIGPSPDKVLQGARSPIAALTGDDWVSTLSSYPPRRRHLRVGRVGRPALHPGLPEGAWTPESGGSRYSARGPPRPRHRRASTCTRAPTGCKRRCAGSCPEGAWQRRTTPSTN